MTDESVSPLRRRMIEDVKIRSFSQNIRLRPPRQGLRPFPRSFAALGGARGPAPVSPAPGGERRRSPDINLAVSALRFFSRSPSAARP
jgi:hypothetical protein